MMKHNFQRVKSGRKPFSLVHAFTLSLFMLASCVTEYQPDTVQIPPSLVIEGQITDQDLPYTVQLSRTADYTVRSLNLIETGATVVIDDNAGNRETLREVSGGMYQTRAGGIRGVAGRSYKLTVLTKTGKRYESDQEVLQKAPPIQKLYYEYQSEAIPGLGTQKQAWNVYLDTKDPETTGNFYRWEWASYKSIEVCRTTQRRNEIPLGASCCSLCWDIIRCYNCININSDANINGQAISRQFIAEVPYTSKGPYYLEVQQQALSKGAYAFWKSVRQLVNNTGGLFDAAPTTVQGNLRCVSDTAERVYGYFGATGISEQFIYVDRSSGQGVPTLEPPVFVPQPSACATCENTLSRTPVKPRWWTY